MILTLENQEAEMLKRLLEYWLMELRDEIHHTDRPLFKAELRGQEVVLRNIIAKVGQGMETAPALTSKAG
jgi:hypothetical protein